MSIENLNWKNLNSKQRNPWENVEIKQEIGEALDEKQSLLQMIWKIEDEWVKSVLSAYVTEWRCTVAKMQEELGIYSNLKISSYGFAELNDIISKYHLLPSLWIQELKAEDEIFSEKDSEVKELMKMSLEGNVKPSIIVNGKKFYKSLAIVEGEIEKSLISRYLREWYAPKSVFDEYEIFGEIMSYPYKDENLRNFLLSLIKDEDVLPSFIELYFDLLKDKEFWEETENYIRWLLNQPKK